MFYANFLRHAFSPGNVERQLSEAHIPPEQPVSQPPAADLGWRKPNQTAKHIQQLYQLERRVFH